MSNSSGINAVPLSEQIEEFLEKSGEGQFERIAIGDIRTDIGGKFSNPRKENGFDPENMAQLERAIAAHGVIQPPIVRCAGDGQYEVIAGGRRIRAIRSLHERNEDVWDETSNSFRPASEVYSHVICRVRKICDDTNAFMISWIENDCRVALSDVETIDLCTLLEEQGNKRVQIGKILDKSPAWVTQTFNIRDRLDSSLFEKLKSGIISRNYALKVIELPVEDRQSVLESAVQIAEEKHKDRLERSEALIVENAVAVEDAEKALEVAETESEVARANKKLQSAQKKLESSRDRQEKIKKQGVTFVQGDIEDARARAGKPKTISVEYLRNTLNEISQFTNQSDRYPANEIAVVIHALKALVDGEDVFSSINEYYGIRENHADFIEVEEEDPDAIAC